MRIALAVAALLSLTHAAVADTPPARPAWQPDVAAQRAAIDRVGWRAGEWEGQGWVDTPAGRQTFRQTETVERRLGGLLLVIEGRGYSGAPEALAFNAFAVLSHDDRTGKYTFRSHTRGYATDAAAEVAADGSLVWRMTPPGQIIRYTITRPGPDAWHEIGERSTDGGTTWTQFFEMALTRKRP